MGGLPYVIEFSNVWIELDESQGRAERAYSWERESRLVELERVGPFGPLQRSRLERRVVHDRRGKQQRTNHRWLELEIKLHQMRFP